MMRHRAQSDGRSGKTLLWLLLLVLLPAAALLWKEYPALVRYIKIERM
jgi:hypothetical protein